MSYVEHIADTILIMKNGQMLHCGSLENIMGVIDGKVFEFSADSKTAELLFRRYPVINFRTEGENVLLRLVCDENPSAAAVNVPATLEDLYLYYFSEVNEHG